MANTYALIDGVMHRNAIKELYSRQEPLQTIPLYINTPYKENYDLGPILVACLEGSNLMSEIKQNWQTSATIIQSDKTLSVIAQHLQQLITVTDDSGTESLFRFADPLTTWFWLTSYQPNALADIMGPISQWQVAKPIPDWQEQTTGWQTFTKPENVPLGFQINHLDEQQEEALQLAADFRYQNKMYHWLQKQNPKLFANKTPDEITDWLKNSFIQAKANNLISERSIAMWIDLCADYGLDFAERQDSLYQKWLLANPEQKRLPIEVKIQKFYQYINT